jgi:glycosyltransferase
MKFSIITVSYNSCETIKTTIDSVVSQKQSGLEYIIIDGGSTDGTLDIIKEYQAKFPITLVSGPDNGLYDAMNKGLRLASGEIVGILNSDDLFFDNDILSEVAHVFAVDAEIDAVYGDLAYFKNDDINKVVRYWRVGEYSEKKLNNGWIIPHPTLFIKASFYDSHPQWFKPDFKLAGDYEMILRFLKIYKMRVKYLPKTLVRMRVGGLSGRDLKQRRLGWQELCLAWKANNLKVPYLFIIRRVVSKFSQLLVRFKPDN